MPASQREMILLNTRRRFVLRLVGRKRDDPTPKFVARFDELGEFRQFCWFSYEAISIQRIYLPYEFRII